MDNYFPNTVYRVGEKGLADIEDDIHYYHDHAFDPLGLKIDTSLKSLGFHKFRRGPQSEVHMYSPETIVLLQRATQTNDYQLFKEYSHQLEVSHLLYVIY